MMRKVFATDNGYREQFESEDGAFCVELCRSERHGAPTVAVNTYYTDPDGRCLGLYNPTCRRGGAGFVLDPEWVLPDTPENRAALLAEAERMRREDVRK